MGGESLFSRCLCVSCVCPSRSLTKHLFILGDVVEGNIVRAALELIGE